MISVFNKSSILKPLFEKADFELTKTDGKNVFVYDFSRNGYLSKGDIKGEGKKYLGFASILWQKLISDDPFSFTEKSDTLLFEKEEIINERLCKTFLIKRKSYYSRIYIVKVNDYVARIENMTPQNEKPGASVFEYRSISFNKDIDDSFFLPVPLLSKEQQTNPISDIANFDGNLLKIGSMAPDFTLLRLEGVKESLSEHKGKMVIMDFWSTWCSPCKLYEH